MNDHSDIKTLEWSRTALAHGFLKHCLQVNGAHVFKHSHTTMELDLDVVIKAIENHIEGAFLEQDGNKLGKQNSIKIYEYMLDLSTFKSSFKDVSLTKVGIELMTEMFQMMINEFESNGFQLPKKPILH